MLLTACTSHSSTRKSVVGTALSFSSSFAISPAHVLILILILIIFERLTKLTVHSLEKTLTWSHLKQHAVILGAESRAGRAQPQRCVQGAGMHGHAHIRKSTRH